MVMWLPARFDKDGVVQVKPPGRDWMDINQTPYWLVNVVGGGNYNCKAVVKLTDDGSFREWRVQ